VGKHGQEHFQLKAACRDRMNALGKVFGNATKSRFDLLPNDLTQIADMSLVRTLAVFLACRRERQVTRGKSVLKGLIGVAFVGINFTPCG
jgi:hypothetical protein